MTRRRFRYPTLGMLLAVVLAALGVYGLGWVALAVAAQFARAIGVR